MKGYRPLGIIISASLFCLSCASTTTTKEPGSESGALYREAAEQAGLRFQHFIGATGRFYLPEIMTAGVAVLDYDLDGDLDVYYVQGDMMDGKPPSESIFPPPTEHWPGSRLFRNELMPEGALRFTDVTEQAGVGRQGYGIGAAVGDMDNDGDPDLYVTGFGPNTLYRNNGDGTFADVTETAGVNDERWSTSASFLDYDRDGDLDLFCVNYVDFNVRGVRDCFDTAGSPDYCSPAVYNPVPDRLFRNEGNGRFSDVSVIAGLGAAFGSGLGVTAADINGDGWMDLMVANDGNANQMWENQRNGAFEDVGLLGGTAYNAHGQPEASMGVTLGDFDNDGDEDIFMCHLTRETNTLYVNQGNGVFEDATDRYGLGSPSFLLTGFGSHWFDYDHDGWQDLLIVNGAVTIVDAQRGNPFPFLQPTSLYRNLTNGQFEEVGEHGGAAFRVQAASRGAAFGDIDNDGDIDVAVANGSGPAQLLLNEVGNHRPWLQVKLEGRRSNRDGLGARVAVIREGKPLLWRRVHRDGSYTSSNDVRVHFGLGDGPEIQGVGVVWPNGAAEMWSGMVAGREEKLVEGSGQPWDAP